MTLYIQAVTSESVEAIFKEFVPGYTMLGAFKITGTESLMPGISRNVFSVYFFDKDTPDTLQYKVVIGSWDALNVIVGGVNISGHLRMFGVRQLLRYS
jgi:hypothetical protein